MVLKLGFLNSNFWPQEPHPIIGQDVSKAAGTGLGREEVGREQGGGSCTLTRFQASSSALEPAARLSGSLLSVTKLGADGERSYGSRRDITEKAV